MEKQKIGLLRECVHLKGGNFHEHLKIEYAEALERLVSASEDYHVLQGEARQLKALINLIETAKDALIKAENPRPNMNKVF